jgi:hypothetical protein
MEQRDERVQATVAPPGLVISGSSLLPGVATPGYRRAPLRGENRRRSLGADVRRLWGQTQTTPRAPRRTPRPGGNLLGLGSAGDRPRAGERPFRSARRPLPGGQAGAEMSTSPRVPRSWTRPQPSDLWSAAAGRRFGWAFLSKCDPSRGSVSRAGLGLERKAAKRPKKADSSVKPEHSTGRFAAARSG